MERLWAKFTTEKVVMALTTNDMLSQVKDYLDIDECKGYWSPDGQYIYPCGLQLTMRYANENAYWWGPSLTEVHQGHHLHSDGRPWDVIEQVENLGVISRIRFWCSCDPDGETNGV